VTSGTGVIGYRVAISLLEAGHKDVRVGIWRGDRQSPDRGFVEVERALIRKGAECVEFDWAKEEGEYDCCMVCLSALTLLVRLIQEFIFILYPCLDYARALAGVKTVFCTMPHMQGWADAFPAFLKECKANKLSIS
jgi:hypothetical protein